MSWTGRETFDSNEHKPAVQYLQSPTILFSIILVVTYVLVFFAPSIVELLLIQCNPCILMTPGWPWTPWTLVTSIFLHASPLHLASNIFFLLIFGYILEEQLRNGKLWVEIFVLTGIAGNLSFLAAYALIGPDVGVFGVGASGAVYGILGAAAGLKIAILLILVAGLDIFAGGGFFAHIGGLITGIVIRKYWIAKANENIHGL